ncbi:hypothetical protein BDW74DRAFT_147197 [Aspergillus multicolor]|uniref:uncharacterized protein n=1 Tax=Aspergillus multicolor TaxID=41759 RepID=UPI003CCDFC83
MNPRLPPHIFDMVASHLGSGHHHTESFVSDALGMQATLLPSVLQALVARFVSSDSYSSSRVWNVLKKRDDFFLTLPEYPHECLVQAFSNLTSIAFGVEGTIYCYFHQDNFCIHLPERPSLLEVPINCPEDKEKLLFAFAEAQRRDFCAVPAMPFMWDLGILLRASRSRS